MTSASNSVPSTSTALVPYDPTLPHVALRSHLEKVTDELCRRSLDIAKFESRHLSPLGQKWKERIVTGVAVGISHLYVDKGIGERMAALITRNFRLGNYDTSSNPFSFKQAILQDLKSIYPDKHLDLLCSEHPIPEYDPDRSLITLKEEDYTLEQINYMNSFGRSDFSKEVESYIIPDTQIGYFKINMFPSPNFPETKTIIDESLRRIANAEALIIDLRKNNGGSPTTVALVASHLFDDKQLINQIYQRSSNELTSFYAEPSNLGPVFGGKKPIYILTSERTFSAGEELAYDLQSSNRAIVIGQTTAGGAHPVRQFVVDDHIYAVIPFERAINPHTGKNWEGVGVIPDHLIAKDTDALAFARALIEE